MPDRDALIADLHARLCRCRRRRGGCPGATSPPGSGFPGGAGDSCPPGLPAVSAPSRFPADRLVGPAIRECLTRKDDVVWA